MPSSACVFEPWIWKLMQNQNHFYTYKTSSKKKKKMVLGSGWFHGEEPARNSMVTMRCDGLVNDLEVV